VDVVPLEDAAFNIRGVRGTGTEALDCRVFVAESLKEGERESPCIKRLFR
jgi:hypothetical protein